MQFAILLVTLLSLATPAAAHGRLTIPQSRQARNGSPDYLMNEPVSGGLSSSAFVCRDQPDPGAPYVDITAGSSFDMTWSFTANHVGDCFLYVSYDLNVANPQQREWFKISNLVAGQNPPKDCRVNNNVPTAVDVPDWLPNGRAVFRWEWYALHQRQGGSIEYYSQCFDAQVTNVGSTSDYTALKSSISPRFTIGTHLPVVAVDYRSGFNPACDEDLRTCGGKGLDGPLGDDFLVGPEIATFSGSGDGGGDSGGDSDSNDDELIVCSFVFAASDCSGPYTESHCRAVVATDCDAVDTTALLVPQSSEIFGSDPSWSEFDSCTPVTSKLNLALQWSCSSEAPGPGDAGKGGSGSSDFGPGFATGMFVTAGLITASVGGFMFYKKSKVAAPGQKDSRVEAVV